MGHPATSDRQEREFVWGQLLRATILTTATETDGRHDLIEASTPPGEQTPLHLHTRYDERLWVISGSLTVWAGPDKVTLRSGDYYAIPMNTAHMIQTGPEGARALNISSPAGFAELVARTGTPARLATAQTEHDTGLFMAVTTELGDLVLGPPGTTPAETGHSTRPARNFLVIQAAGGCGSWTHSPQGWGYWRAAGSGRRGSSLRRTEPCCLDPACTWASRLAWRYGFRPITAPFAPGASNQTVRMSWKPRSSSHAPYSAGV